MFYTHERRTEKAPVINAPMPKASGGHDQGDVDKYLSSRLLSPLLAKRNGWYPSRDAGDAALRVVIPCTNSLRYNYWQARAIDKWVSIRYQSPRCARTDSIVVVYPDVISSNSVVIVEGPMDALAAAMLGFKAVAVMGNTPSNSVLDFLVREVAGTKYLLVADSDAPSAAASTAHTLSAEQNVRAFVIQTYPEKDLAACSPSFRKAVLSRYA